MDNDPQTPQAPDRAEEKRVDTPQNEQGVPTEGTDTGTPQQDTSPAQPQDASVTRESETTTQRVEETVEPAAPSDDSE